MIQIYIKLFCLFLLIMGVGTFLTVILYKFDIQKFLHSELAKKILVWIPIFIVYISIVASPNPIKLLSLFILISCIVIESIRVIMKQRKKRIFFLYITCIAIALLHINLINDLPVPITPILLSLLLGTAMSDVTCFFFGKFFGTHMLPPYINSNKSWEGVAGQLIGACIGLMLLKTFIFPQTSLLLFLPIGLGSATGDLLNSYIKRRAGILSWSTWIPGHGGLLDRFVSLAFSILYTFYFLLLYIHFIH